MFNLIQLLFLLTALSTFVLGDFHILQGSCTEKDAVPPDCPGCGPSSTTSRWTESRLMPSNQYGCKYLQTHAPEVATTSNIWNVGSFDAYGFCGKDISLYKRAGNTFDLYWKGNGNKVSSCYNDQQSMTCKLSSGVISTTCTYTRIAVCAGAPVC